MTKIRRLFHTYFSIIMTSRLACIVAGETLREASLPINLRFTQSCQSQKFLQRLQLQNL